MKTKFQVEFPIHTTVKMLYPRISTASGLEQWFAEQVKVKGNEFTFIWSGIAQLADLTAIRENQLVRFSWKDDPEKTYFELRIKIDEITNDMALVVTDFAEEEDKHDSIELWHTQILNLKHLLGLMNE
jgi:hypothetical protein